MKSTPKAGKSSPYKKSTPKAGAQCAPYNLIAPYNVVGASEWIMSAIVLVDSVCESPLSIRGG